MSSRPPEGARGRVTSAYRPRAVPRALPLIWRLPLVGDRLAERLVLTPFGAPKPEDLAPPRAAGEPSTVRARRRISAVKYGEGAPVFLVHGWGGRGAQMNGFVDALVERGHAVWTFDLPAHGASAGLRTHVVETSEALLALADKAGAPAGIVAHSFGAAASALAQSRGLGARAFAFVAPLPSLDEGIRQFAVRSALPLEVAERVSRRLQHRLALDPGFTSLAAAGPRLETPLLIAHDEEDHVIALAHSRAVAAAWPAADLWVTRGLGHRRILRNPEVVERIASFVSERASSFEGAERARAIALG